MAREPRVLGCGQGLGAKPGGVRAWELEKVFPFSELYLYPRTLYLHPGSFPGRISAACKARPGLGQVGKEKEYRHGRSLSAGLPLSPQELNEVDLSEAFLVLIVSERPGSHLCSTASFGGRARSRPLAWLSGAPHPSFCPCGFSGANSQWPCDLSLTNPSILSF